LVAVSPGTSARHSEWWKSPRPPLSVYCGCARCGIWAFPLRCVCKPELEAVAMHVPVLLDWMLRGSSECSNIDSMAVSSLPGATDRCSQVGFWPCRGPRRPRSGFARGHEPSLLVIGIHSHQTSPSSRPLRYQPRWKRRCGLTLHQPHLSDWAPFTMSLFLAPCLLTPHFFLPLG